MVAAPPLSERRLLLLVGAVQFVNILDFMIVMPLGPDLAHGLAIPTSQLGLVGGSYTAAAAIAGLAGSAFLDRFDRRRALAVAMVGLVLGTLAGAMATGLYTLLAARVVAGAFGGPATAIALAMVADVVPPERRGRAMGAVMGAFSVAAVLGVPAGLELARSGSWRTPFLAVGALAALVTAVAIALLPAMTGHLRARTGPAASLLDVVRRPLARLSLTATALAVVANFALIPNLSAYLQFNLGYPRQHLGLLYAVGGAISFVTMRVAGAMTDRYGSAPVAAGGSVAFAGVLVSLFIAPLAGAPVLLLFVGFMVAGNFRFVPLQALTSKVPGTGERAQFMSAQSAVQHLASAVGATAGTLVLTELPDHRLVGMDQLAWMAIATSAALPLIMAMVEARVRRRAAAGAA